MPGRGRNLGAALEVRIPAPGIQFRMRARKPRRLDGATGAARGRRSPVRRGGREAPGCRVGPDPASGSSSVAGWGSWVSRRPALASRRSLVRIQHPHPECRLRIQADRGGDLGASNSGAISRRKPRLPAPTFLRCVADWSEALKINAMPLGRVLIHEAFSRRRRNRGVAVFLPRMRPGTRAVDRPFAPAQDQVDSQAGFHGCGKADVLAVPARKMAGRQGRLDRQVPLFRHRREYRFLLGFAARTQGENSSASGC